MKVLIVDDHALFRVGLEMLLSQLVSPLEVSQAANAHQALGMIGAALNTIANGGIFLPPWCSFP